MDTQHSAHGLTNPAGSGTGNITETLTNISTSPIDVIYTYYLTAYGCTSPQNLDVIVNPTPVLSSSLAPAPVCYGVPFSYTATSATVGTTYSWRRSSVSGISNTGVVGTLNPYTDLLVDTTTNPVLVTLTYFLIANGCHDTENVLFDARPNPVLSSSLTPATCSNVLFNYPAATATSGTLLTWQRLVYSPVSPIYLQ